MTMDFLDDDVDYESGTHNFNQLKREIISRSDAKTWSEARLEWRLSWIDIAPELRGCLCGHFPIREICYLTNIKNRSRAEVGNVCVNKFMGINSAAVFRCLGRIRKDDRKSLTPDAYELFHDNGVLTDWEYEFCEDTCRSRNLTDRQMLKRRNINRKVLRSIEQKPRSTG